MDKKYNPINPRKITDIESEIRELKDIILNLPNIASKYIRMKKGKKIEHSAHIQYLVNLVFHNQKNLVSAYNLCADDISERIRDIILSAALKKGEIPGVIVTGSKHAPKIFFELNNFVISAKILADNIRVICPKVDGEMLSKSVSKILKKVRSVEVRNPLFKAMEMIQDELEYLINFRDYLVHYGVFGTSTGTCLVDIFNENILKHNEVSFNEIDGPAVLSMQVFNGDLKFNIFIPDAFRSKHMSAGFVKSFTYADEINMLSWVRNVFKMIGLLITVAISTQYNLSPKYVKTSINLLNQAK